MPTDTSKIYVAFYRTRPRTSIYDRARVVADSLEEATAKARAAVAKRFPDGAVLRVFLATKSPWGAINADGKCCLASEVY